MVQISKVKTKLLASITIVAMMVTMMVGMVPKAASAGQVSDVSTHWAKAQINDWVDKGYINGYPDGTFKPENNISRAEFMTLINGAFGYKEKATIDYKDVSASDWFADVVAQAQAAGYITGYGDGTMKPNSPISRQEAAMVIMKIKHLDPNVAATDKFKDAASIDDWSKGAIGATAAANIMVGYPDETFKANNQIKRAEAVVALSKALGSTVSINAIADTKVEAAKTVDVTVTTTPADASIEAVSSDNSQATVAATGPIVTITGVAVGEVMITVTAEKAGLTSGTETFTVTVTAPSVNVVAETAVAAYEASTVTSYADLAAAATLKAAADKAVAEVTDATAQADFAKRVSAQTAAIEKLLTEKVSAVNEAGNQVKLLAALSFFDDVSEDLIVAYDAKLDGSQKTIDDMQKAVYEVNFLSKFAKAIGTPAAPALNVNQLVLKNALAYGADQQVLVNVRIDKYFDAYVATAEAYTNVTDYDTVNKIQTGMLDAATTIIVNAADTAVKTAMDAPAGQNDGKYLIDIAQAAVDQVPTDLVGTSETQQTSGVLVELKINETLNARLNDLRKVQPVILAVTANNQIDLLAVLKANGFARVYDSNIVAYVAGIPNSGDGVTATGLVAEDITIPAIQNKIDDINDAQASKLVILAEANPTTATVAAAQTAIDGLLPDFEATKTMPARSVVKGLQDRLTAAQLKIVE